MHDACVCMLCSAGCDIVPGGDAGYYWPLLAWAQSLLTPLPWLLSADTILNLLLRLLPPPCIDVEDDL